MSFRAVNQRGAIGYDAGLQRHHLLPFQLVGASCFRPFFDGIGRVRIGFDDFRRNGLLLPAREDAARLMGLPMHRGPHRSYNELVIQRVGAIETRWSRDRLRDAERALDDALFRLGLLQGALRRRLLDPAGSAMVLNRRDPAVAAPAFDDLDAMAELLWSETALAA
ncbi:AHH domain-containing protein [Novosphingobium flavum]|uniref:AHH domain-containing protein n=1 Tax=Novosphingobium flavum TaxID=1778672 RepID=A0A7X1FPV7_9SPHN|nr:AHH domain-containing protein [Novosphingobium flavum]